MQIIFTVQELFEHDLWDRYCEITGTNPWAVKEGLMSDYEAVILDKEEMDKLGIVIKKQSDSEIIYGSKKENI